MSVFTKESDTIQNPCHIVLKRSTKGVYSWEIKLAFDNSFKLKEITTAIERVNEDLKKTYIK